MKARRKGNRSGLLLSLALLAALLSGCAGGAGNVKSQTGETSSVVNQTGLPIVNEPVTITMMVAKNNSDRTSWKDKEAIKMIERDTGLKLDITEVPAMAWTEKINVTIASGDLPDVIIGGIPNLTLNKDSLLPLNDLIDQYSPTLVQLYENHPEYKFAGTVPDGNMYSLPLLQSKGAYANIGFSINQAWLDKLKLKMPETTDELYETLKAFKEKDPNGNGLKDEIPYSFYTDGYYGLDPMLWHFNLVNDGSTHVMVEDGKVIFVPSDPRYLEYLKYLHKLYSEGLIDPDGFVQKNTDFVTKGNKGIIGFFNHHSYADIVVGTDHVNDYVDIVPMKDKDGHRTVMGEKAPGDFKADQFAISKNAKHPEAIIRMYDYMNADFERMMTLSFGRKDVIWGNVDDGKWEKITTIPTGLNNFAEFRHTESPGMSGFYLLTDEHNDRLKLTDPRDIKLQNKQQLYLPHLKKEVLPLGMDTMEAQQDKNTMYTEINTYIQNFLAQSVLKGVDDAQWKTHLDNLGKMNITKYVKLHQDFYDRSQESMK